MWIYQSGSDGKPPVALYEPISTEEDENLFPAEKGVAFCNRYESCRDSKSKQPECLQVSVHPASVYAGLQK